MDEFGPWTRLATEVAYQNPWITVRHDTVVTPGGTEGVYGVVEVESALGVVPLHADGTVTLVGQYRYPLRAYSWEIPEGAARNGEAEQVGALRELAEETGLRAGRITPLGTMHTSNCFTNEVAHLFLAEDLVAGPADPDPTEVLTVKRIALTEAMAMVRDGRIQDSMSIVALYRVEATLSQR